jgi:methyl-accepting chemotaxis protein
MYGDMVLLGQRSIELRTMATETRADAGTLRNAVGTTWVSDAAAKYTEDLHERADNLDTSAVSLEEAADAIDAHIESVEAVKQAIAEAERWISDRWNDAARLVGNTVEVIKEGAENVFEFFGTEVPRALVSQADELIRTVSALPQAGSPEWLDLADTFRRRGW